MPRTARVLLPNTPHHVVQRGHNRSSVFAEPSDFEYYLRTLGEWKRELGVKVFAYCLMTNHVHLVLQPGEDTNTTGKLMRRLAGRQTRLVNALENRTGTLWAGRYKASPIQTSRYLLACCRYVEMNPVRAGMVSRPPDYPWSSHTAKITGDYPDWLDVDPCFEALGDSHEQRVRSYRAIFDCSDEETDRLIRSAVQRNQLTGNRQFVDEVEQRLGRRIELRGRGRPRGSAHGREK